MSEKIVSYVRVSTKGQQESGLSLESQNAAVERFSVERKAKIVGKYVECESGSNNERPMLLKAIAQARLTKATLIVAKLDRLCRDIGFLARLRDSNVQFLALDNLSANTLTLNILMAVAQNELELISARTKAALQAEKDRGQLLGSSRPNHWEGREHLRKAGLAKAIEQSAKSRKESTKEAYSFLIPLMIELRQNDRTLKEIADHLNDLGHTTQSGCNFNQVSVLRILRRYTNKPTVEAG